VNILILIGIAVSAAAVAAVACILAASARVAECQREQIGEADDGCDEPPLEPGAGDCEKQCSCVRCRRERFEQAHGTGSFYPMFFACATCRRDDCPHAIDHRLPCSHANR